MIPRRFALYLLPLVGLLASPPAGAGDPAHEWLMKMSRAARTLDYDGIFVYQHDTRLEAMRILHRLEKGGPQERLVALNGAAREIIRNEREVLWAIATRSQWDRDVMIFPGTRGGGLDPSTGIPGEGTSGCIDCTKPWGKPFEEVVNVDKEVYDRVQLEEYIPSDKLYKIPQERM